MITTHVIDTALGRPAAGVHVELEVQRGGKWEFLGRGETDAGGRLRDLVPNDRPIEAGHYRLRFDTGAYFARQQRKTFYLDVLVVFRVEKAGEHHHVPLLLSPFGYSTYRGS